MTRRRAIAGAGLCALLLPGCLGGNLNGSRPGARQGLVLIEPARGQGLYGPGRAGDGAAKNVSDAPRTPPVAPSPRPGTTEGVVQVAVPKDQSPPRPTQPVEARLPAERPLSGGPPPLPPPDPPAEPPDPPVAAVESRSDQPAVGPDWDKISQALAGGRPTPVKRTARSLPGSPAATLELPVKADPLATGSTLPSANPAEDSREGPSGLAEPPAPLNPPGALPDLNPAPAANSIVLPTQDNSPPQNPIPAQNSDLAPSQVPIGSSVAPAPPTAPDSPLLELIRAYQNNRPDEALAYLRQYDAANQEVMLYLVPLVVRLGERNLGTMPPEELAVFVDRLQGATGVMRTRAALRLDAVRFCRRVANYGKYEPLDARHSFQPGEPVQLYAEVRNFTWEPASPAPPAPAGGAAARGFTMRLANTLEIRDRAGKVVWRAELPREDTRQTPPADYYLVYSFQMPEGLPPGAYTLDVKVADRPTGRVVRKVVEFRMGVRQ